MNLCYSKDNVGAGYNTLKILVAKYQQFKKRLFWYLIILIMELWTTA